MKALRRALFYIFLVLYLAAAPTAILYALGYIYKPGSEHGLVQSGLVSIASTPDDALVFLGDSRYTRRTPAVLRDLLPGTYVLRLAREGSDAWQTLVEVKPERATLIDRVLLLPAGRATRIVHDAPIDALVDDPGEERLLLVHRKRLGDARVYDAGDRTIRPLLAAGDSPWADATVTRLWTVRGSPCALVHATARGDSAYLWFDLDDEDEPPLDITRLFPEPPDDVRWDPRADDELYTRVGERTHRLDLDAMAIFPDLAPPARGVALNRKRLYALTGSNTLVRVERDGDAPESNYTIPAELAKRLDDGAHHLHPLPDDVLLLRNEDGALLANTPPWVVLPRGVRALLPDTEEEQWLVTTERALGLLEVVEREDDNEEEDDEEEGKKGTEIRVRWLHEHPHPIQRVAWMHDNTHLLFSSEGRIWLLALERGGGGPPREIATLHRDGAFAFSERTGDVVFLQADRRVAAMNLLPPRSLIPLPSLEEEAE